ncbi:MAG: SDR family oxidoreductase [Actinomycetota bacterium]
MPAPRSLEGAVVAVVGVHGGLGAPIADELRSRGAHVIGAGRRDAEVLIDLRDAAAGHVLVEAARSGYGHLDGVVNAAGIVGFGNLADTDDVVVEELLLTNALGPMWLAKSVTPALVATKGFFVNISGVVAEQPMPGMAAYSASKAAAAAALAAWRREVRRDRIDVIDIQPPHTETGLASRPLAGTAPALPAGAAPTDVARRTVDAIVDRELLVTADLFA